MKRIALAALAMITLLGMTSCDLLGSTTSSTTTPTVTLSDWKIKGSFDGWVEHQLTVSELNSKSLSYEITGLYQDAVNPIVYEFVLVNGAGKEYKIAGTANVTPGTAFTLGDSSTAGSLTVNNVKFTASKSSYTATVDITAATAPSVNLIGGATDAPAVTNAVLAQKLTIKGDAFSIGWTDTAGTFDAAANTVSWDVTYNTKNGSFGFSSIDGFLKGVTIDLSTLTAGGAGTTAVDLLTTGENAKLTGAPKAGSVYTISVVLDVAQAVASGKYMISAKLKTLSNTDWAFDVPASIWFVGRLEGVAGMTVWSEADSGRKEVTVTSSKAVLTYTTPDTVNQQEFKFAKAAGSGWNNLVGGGAVTYDNSGANVPLSGTDNMLFTVLANTNYTVTVDFGGTYTTTGIPTVKVTTP